MLKLRGDNLGNYSTRVNPKICKKKNTSEDLEKFYSYFKKLNAQKQQNEEYILTRSEALGPLDYEISEQETVTAIDLLKTGKAPGVDNILCELLKHGKEALKGPLTILFNQERMI